MPSKLGLSALAILSLSALSATVIPGGSSDAGEATKPPEAQVRGPIVGTAVMVDFEEQFAMEQERLWNIGVWERGVAEAAWNKGVWDAGVARAAEEAAAAAARQAQAPRATGYHPGTTDGACTGFSIPDYIIQRESGGNPSAYNPSGAYGCAQTLLSHYSSGSCRGLDPYTIEGQRACVDILSGGGTNLAPWAQTR